MPSDPCRFELAARSLMCRNSAKWPAARRANLSRNSTQTQHHFSTSSTHIAPDNRDQTVDRPARAYSSRSTSQAMQASSPASWCRLNKPEAAGSTACTIPFKPDTSKNEEHAHFVTTGHIVQKPLVTIWDQASTLSASPARCNSNAIAPPRSATTHTSANNASNASRKGMPSEAALSFVMWCFAPAAFEISKPTGQQEFDAPERVLEMKSCQRTNPLEQQEEVATRCCLRGNYVHTARGPRNNPC